MIEPPLTLNTIFEGALDSTEPVWELRGALRALLALGHDRDQLQEELTEYLVEMRTAGREREEDVVLEVLDYLAGWCSSRMKL